MLPHFSWCCEGALDIASMLAFQHATMGYRCMICFIFSANVLQLWQILVTRKCTTLIGIKPPILLLCALIWCPRRDSNSHAREGGGF